MDDKLLFFHALAQFDCKASDLLRNDTVND